ncbi:Dipeptide transport system permease protein DppB [bacterium HR29]|jgi:peptide/nickel transport system permease protein|nr:Dipeptide transport system permease protein DppB [bacterium HR29]
MTAYVVNRLILLIVSLLGVTVLVALIVRLLPASAIEVLAAQQGFSEAADLDRLEHELGLDRPFLVQYGTWLAGVLRGDFGDSLRTRRPISDELKARLPVSLQLAGMAFVVAVAVAIPVGVLSAVRQNTLLDYTARSLAITGVALPGFWVATLVVVWPSVWWGWSPPLTYTSFMDDPLTNVSQMWIPAVLLGLYFVGFLMRMTRAMMLEVLRSDYVRTAWAKGLAPRVVILRHALRNALIPIVTVIGLQLPVLVGGAVVYEMVFTVPGIGRLLLEAVQNRDYPVTQAVNFVLAGIVLTANLAVDLSYTALDPRVRLGGE